MLGDVDRDGDTTDRFAVLLDPQTDEVRVDSDDDDLTNDPAMRPYGTDLQSGVFGSDEPGTDVVEAMPFTVDVREDVGLGALGRPDLVDDWSTSPSPPAPTARTSPASSPPTTCSAGRWTARRPAPRSSRPGRAPSVPAAPQPR